MDRLNILSLLGLSLRGGRLAVGEEPVEAVARARDARVLLLASDAADGTRRRCEHFAAHGDCMWLQIPFTKAELGRALGRTSVALAAVTDVGLAAALLHRLAELDPEQYRDAADRMDVKARRAAERRAEQAAHTVAAQSERRHLRHNIHAVGDKAGLGIPQMGQHPHCGGAGIQKHHVIIVHKPGGIGRDALLLILAQLSLCAHILLFSDERPPRQHSAAVNLVQQALIGQHIQIPPGGGL